MGRRRFALGFAIAGAAAMACNALTGVGDLTVASSTADGAASDAANDAPVQPIVDSGGGDGFVPIDAGPPPLCPSKGNSCVPAAPDGWDGPFLMYSGDRQAAPDCPAVMPRNDDEQVGDPQGSITCADCRCGNSRNVNCTVVLSEFTDTACTPPSAADLDPSTCQVPPAGSDGGSGIAVAFAQGGFCDKLVATKTPSDITWPDVARLCSRDDDFVSDGCDAGSLCVPDGVQPYLPHTCIRQLHADLDCPVPWTQKTTTFNNVADNRDCSTDGCNCGSVNGAACQAAIRIYQTNPSCGGAPTTTVKTPTGCIVGTPTTSAKLLPGSITFSSGGSCEPSGTPTPTGRVAGGDDVNTIWCVP